MNRRETGITGGWVETELRKRNKDRKIEDSDKQWCNKVIEGLTVWQEMNGMNMNTVNSVCMEERSTDNFHLIAFERKVGGE